MSASQVQPAGRRRWGIAVLLGVSVLFNYFDRLALSVAGPQLTIDLHLDAFALGVLFSAFSWSYAILQVPSGMILDRYGVKYVGRIGILLWGVASAITAMAGGYGGILVARMLLGAAEAPSFPLNSKAVGHWFPRSERSTATSMFDGMAKFSQVIGVPLVALVLVSFGWRGAFWTTAALSFAFLIAFWAFYRDPSEDERLSPAEHAYILAGGAMSEGRSGSSSLAMLGYALGRRKVWGLTLGFACYGYSNSMFASWLPIYFVQTQNVGILKSASFTMLPWFIATISQFVIGGWLVDWLIKRGRDETLVRKSILIACFLIGLAVIGAAFTTQIFWVLFWMTVSVSALTTASTIGWSFPSLVAPRGGGATVGSIMNTANAAMGSISAIVTGGIVQATGSFSGAFVVAACVLLAGIGFYTFLLGRIEPVPDMPQPGQVPRTVSQKGELA
jgi:MFS transporter, ACS family, D-galactonate transporter